MKCLKKLDQIREVYLKKLNINLNKKKHLKIYISQTLMKRFNGRLHYNTGKD